MSGYFNNGERDLRVDASDEHYCVDVDGRCYNFDTGEENYHFDSDLELDEGYGPEPESDLNSPTEAGPDLTFLQNPSQPGAVPEWNGAAELYQCPSAMYGLWCTDCQLLTEGTLEMKILDIPISCSRCGRGGFRVDHATPEQSGNGGQRSEWSAHGEPNGGSGGNAHTACGGGHSNNGTNGSNATVITAANTSTGSVSSGIGGRAAGNASPHGSSGTVPGNSMVGDESQARGHRSRFT